MRTILPALLVLILAPVIWTACHGTEPGEGVGGEGATAERDGRLRIALFNVRELTLERLRDVGEDGAGRDPQLQAAAAILRRVRPDILVLQEIDHENASTELGADDGGGDLGVSARRFVDAYLARDTNPLTYDHVFAAPVNTGVPTGLDLDRNGKVANEDDRGTQAWGGDSFGWGVYPGQYGMAVLSNLPILTAEARTFQRFLWRDLPANHLPEEFFGPEASARLRLSSKSHWDLPLELGGKRLHLLVAHPTPPVFDGPEDRNGRRNFDEIAFWIRYIEDDPNLVDDAGVSGGLGPDERFVVVGDLNADPVRGDALEGDGRAIEALLSLRRVTDTGDRLTARGSLAGREPGPPGHLERSTAVFFDGMRLDYLLPSTGIEVLDGGVFWPAPEDDPEGAAWAEEASDHRLVWLDLAL